MSKQVNYTEKCRRIAGTFYNMGLEKAKIRDLTGACRCLKRSLAFDKYNADARNLLGLIYYEIGETAEALVQWVISTASSPTIRARTSRMTAILFVPIVSYTPLPCLRKPAAAVKKQK